MKPAIVRFAPSPTGPPHLGNLRTALFNWLLARATGGRFILRIDDTDRARYDPSSEEQLLAALRWLELEWDEGPYRQSERLELYRQVAEQLIERGYAYRPADAPQIIRLKTPREGQVTVQDALRGEIIFKARRLPQDIVLIKSDGFPTYHLASVVDDHEMGITHVLRGEEWIPSLPLHVRIFEAMGWSAPVFVHLSLVTDAGGHKIKKREPSFQVSTYREGGYLPEALINYLVLLGWNPGSEEEFFSRERLIEIFSLERLSRSPAAFSEERLRWFNRHYIARLSEERLASLTIPLIQEAYPAARSRDIAWLSKLVWSIREELTTLKDAIPAVRFAFEVGDLTADARQVLASEQVLPVINAFRAALSAMETLDAQSSAELLSELRTRFKQLHGWGGRAVMFPLRAALTRSTTGPHLSDIVALLGKEECLRRIDQVLAEL